MSRKKLTCFLTTVNESISPDGQSASVMYIHKDKTDKLNLHKLAGAFISTNKRRVNN